MPLIHSSHLEPRIFPYMGTRAPSQIDRVQDLSASVSINRTKVKEVGRVSTVGFTPAKPNVDAKVRQYEYGQMNFWRALTNVLDSVKSITQEDFKDSAYDIAGYKTNEAGDFDGTVVWPKLRTSGFSFSIGDPDAIMERNISAVGEDEYFYQGNNAYYIVFQKEVATGEAGTLVITLGGSGEFSAYPLPVVDPDTTKYFQRIVRLRDGDAYELQSTDYTYVNTTGVLTIANAQVGDVYKGAYTASTYITGEVPFTDNDTDAAALIADCVTLYLNVGTQAYALQSASFDISFDRSDTKEIGNKEVINRGVKTTNVSIQLGRLLNGNTTEEILRGVAANYGKIDARNYADDISLTVKIYSDNTKSNFLMAYEFYNLTPSTLDDGAPVDDYTTRNSTLIGEEFLITDDETELATV